METLRQLEFSYRKDAWSKSTINSYKSYIKKFNEFLVRIKKPCYPASNDTVCLFVTLLAESKYNFSTILVAVSAVRAVHILYSHPNPTAGDRISLLLKGIRRNCGKAKDKKYPITVNIMQKFWSNCKEDLGLKLWTSFSLAFCGLLRKSELLRLKWKNIQIEGDNLVWITIDYSKTDQFGVSTKLPLACICDLPWCPLHTTLLYFKVVKNGIFGPKDKNSVLFDISYSNLLKVLRFCLDKIGEPSKVYGLHSFRRGGAQLLRQCNLSTNIIQESGRWASNSYMEYLKMDSGNAVLVADRIKKNL